MPTRFLLIYNVLETFHPVQSLAVLQCRAVVLEPADDVGASQVGLDLQLAVLLRRWPLGSAEHLLGKQTSRVNKQQVQKQKGASSSAGKTVSVKSYSENDGKDLEDLVFLEGRHITCCFSCTTFRLKLFYVEK